MSTGTLSGPPADLVTAYQLFLGRAPNPANHPSEPAADGGIARNRRLAASAEFRASPQAAKTPLPWPLRQVFVSKPARLIYCPIGKNACTFLKSQMARTLAPPHLDYLLNDIHFLTDHLRTGLQFSDYPEAELHSLCHDPDYFRFAVLRAPFDRLLSAYIEKFVMGRNSPENIQHTASVVVPVQRALGFDRVDYDHGITFRQFIACITSADPAKLDAHWRPQALYLAGMQYDALFRIDQIDALMDILEERAAMPLARRALNVTGSGLGRDRHGAQDLLPAQIAASGKLSKGSFYDDGMRAAVRLMYAKDFALFEKTYE